MIDRLDETIVAVSSAPGRGCVGILRLSGDRALSVADQLARLEGVKAPSELAGSRRVRGALRLDECIEVPADFYVFRRPRSYTRQDLVEIHTVGGPVVLEMARRRAVSLGAVPALPGEFTARAFLNGAMDLSRAEGVAAIIQAQSDSQLRASRAMRGGAVGRRIERIRRALAELLARVEADIDFAEEPIEFIRPADLKRRLQHLHRLLSPLLGPQSAIPRYDGLPQIALLGAPNVGKSTLMNVLSGRDRAICAAVAGTTRDVLSSPLQLEGVEAVLLDTAGVDEFSDALPAARKMSLATARRVDVVCLVIDASLADPFARVATFSTVASTRVVAINKCDRITEERAAELSRRAAEQGLRPNVMISARSGEGLDHLRALLAEAVGRTSVTTGGEAMVLSERQQAAARSAAEALARASMLAGSTVATIDRADLLAFELREALDSLGTVTGAVTTDDLLHEVFANFCVGK